MDARFTRRRLVIAGAAGAAAVIAGPDLISAALGRRDAPGPDRVIVVGAGLAGLTAAYELGRAGFECLEQRVDVVAAPMRTPHDHLATVGACQRAT
jgi:NADPH-dependent 2,4-dienoyl-CoA reductase/sulfur reductase-like enzyme